MILYNYLHHFKAIHNNVDIIAYEFERKGSYNQDKLYQDLFHICYAKLPYIIIDRYYKFTDADCIIWFMGLSIKINNL
jgi:hypothetical protein